MNRDKTGDIDLDAYYDLQDEIRLLRTVLVLTWFGILVLTALVVLA